MWRSNNSNNYTKLMTLYYSQIFYFIKKHKNIDMWTQENSLGFTFDDVLNNLFKMREGGEKNWPVTEDKGPRHDVAGSEDWEQIFWMEGIRLNKPEWVTWAKEGKLILTGMRPIGSKCSLCFLPGFDALNIFRAC